MKERYFGERMSSNSGVASQRAKRKILACDNIRRLVDSFLFENLLHGQIFPRAQVPHGEVGIVGSVVRERFLGGVQDFGPFCAEIASESVLKLLRCNILGNC
jgi:hypothetical protein